MRALLAVLCFCIGNSLGKAAETFPLVTEDGAWTWFTDPRALYFQGSQEKTYCGFLTRDGSVAVWSKDHKTSVADTFTLHPKFKSDDHSNPALYLRKDGRLMAFYQKHSSDSLVLYRTTVKPEDISAWGPESVLKMTDAVGYAHIFRIQDRIYLINRSIDYHPTLITSDDEGVTWNAPVKLIGGRGQRPYLKCVSDGRKRIHLAFTDGHPRDEWSNSIHYAYLENDTFHRADGTVIKSLSAGPIDPATESDLVYDGNKSGRAWIWDVALAANGNPVVVFVVFPSNDVHLYYYGAWDGSRWNYHNITEGGSWYPQTPQGQTEPEPNFSAGLILDHEDPSVVYLAKPRAGVFEIEKWSTPDAGESWSVEPITEGSAKPNARPILPWNAGNVKPRHRMLFWMNGDYVFYKDYATGIRYSEWEDETVGIRRLNGGSHLHIRHSWKFDLIGRTFRWPFTF